VWLDAGYTGQDRGAGWVERTLGWTAEIVRHPPKPAPEEVMVRWASREWAKEGGVSMDPKKKLLPPGGPQAVLAEEVGGGADTFSWLGQNKRMSLGTTGVCQRQEKPYLRGDEPPDGQALGPQMRLFRQFRGSEQPRKHASPLLTSGHGVRLLGRGGRP
jgi:hypothetical protein